MNIRLLLIGKTTTPFVKEGVDIYTKRLKHYCKFEIVEVPDAKVKDPSKQKEMEAQAILKSLKTDDFVVLLDEKGAQLSSREYADFLQKKNECGYPSNGNDCRWCLRLHARGVCARRLPARFFKNDFFA